MQDEEKYNDWTSPDDDQDEELNDEEMLLPDAENLDNDDENEFADFLDDVIDENELSEDVEDQSEHRFTQQELIRLKADFDSKDPVIREQARELVYKRFIRLVRFVINKHYASYNYKHHDDLIQVGSIGVLTGFEAYQPDVKGVFYQPSTLITRYIRHEIREYIANTLHDTSAKYVTVGRRMLEIIRRKQENGEEVIPGDIANELNISLTTATRAIEAINANANKVSLEATIKDGETKIIDITPSDMPTPEEAYLQQEFNQNIMDAMKFTLNDIQFKVMYYSYGFDINKERSRKEVARMLNIPEEKIRKILSSAKMRLERYMNSSPQFTSEKRARSYGHSSMSSTKRTDEDLQRELDSLDFSSLGDIGLVD